MNKLPTRRWVGSFFFVMLTALTTPAAADGASDQDYLTDLIHRASADKLSGERFWHLLLHYRKTAWGGYWSEADAPEFFLAPNGKTNPQAELDATIERFFSDDLIGPARQPAQCAFIARYHWLKERLSFDDARLPPHACEAFDGWYAELDPESVTLIFASAFMNNPPSMFGHTLLRIDQTGQTEETRLLAYTINYAADVPADAGFTFPIRGIFGGLKGYFSTIPYYMKVKEYRDIDQRDIWEYRLNFTGAQIRWLLMHAWELGNAYFDYYFFDENCSYHLLSLLEVADPSLHLREHFGVWTVPADTVRLLARQPGLLADVVYRPSLTTRIKRKRAMLSSGETAAFHTLLEAASPVPAEMIADLPRDRQAFVLDLLSDFLRYKSATDKDDHDRYKEKNQKILIARSLLKVPSDEVFIDPYATSPESGHNTSRVSVGAGWHDHDLFEELTLRAGYHDLLDPDLGHTPDAQIEIAALTLRHYNQRPLTRLERFTVASIVSLAPMDRLFTPIAWKISTGYQALDRAGCQWCGSGYFNIGMGAAVESHLWRREVAFGFAEIDANYSPEFEKNHQVGGGMTFGLLAELTSRWKLYLAATYLSFPFGERSSDVRSSLQQRLTLTANLALRLELNRRDHQDDISLALHYYF